MTFAQANQVCYDAGFRRNRGIVIMPSIGWAESRLRSDARGPNTDGSIDRGWLQINSIHTDISDAACDDPLLAARWAFDKTSGGTMGYSAWTTYNSGAYKGPESLVYNLFDMAESVRQLMVDNGQITAKAATDASQAQARYDALLALWHADENKIEAAKTALA